jgi:carbamoyltransferase
MNILGISAFYHDSAAAIVQDGRIVAAAQEERFTRKKHDASFPENAVRFCLEYSGLSLGDLDAVAFYDKPLLKFERLLETYYGFAPKGVRSFIAAIPVWVREKLFLKNLIRKNLEKIGAGDARGLKLLFPEHHLSHAASAFYPSPYEEAAILTIDGVGEWATASICHGQGRDITILKELTFPHSLGLLYSAFTYYLGFKVNSGEYKLMGLAPYGNPESGEVDRYVDLIKRELMDIREDGSIWLNQRYFNYATGLRMADDRKWEKLFGFPRRNAEAELEQRHCDLGLAIQRITEEVVAAMAAEALRLTGSKRLCMAGGVALNCVANGRLLDKPFFDDIFVQPAAGDAGGAPGAALAAHHLYFQKERVECNSLDQMQGAYLGHEYSDMETGVVAKKYKASYKHYEDFGELCREVAAHIEEGNAVGWFQGRMEFGPRALGNRSILGDARNGDMQRKLNLKIKYRESFRPFAPSVLAEDTGKYFDLNSHSPYMLLVRDVVESRRMKAPGNYHELPLREKLYFQRSDVPAITHIDYSARIQTVHQETNPRFHDLIAAFRDRTGYSLLVNTSFNVRGEPIVCTPEDAYRCFMRTEMDFLVVGNLVFNKKEQPEWKEKDNWKEDFVLD